MRDVPSSTTPDSRRKASTRSALPPILRHAGPHGKLSDGHDRLCGRRARQWRVGMRLYLPEAWTAGRERCAAAGVPTTVPFAPKWQHALKLLDAPRDAGVAPYIVLAHSAFVK